MPEIRDLILPRDLRTRSYMILGLICVLSLSLVSLNVAQDHMEDSRRASREREYYRVEESESRTIEQSWRMLVLDVLDVAIEPAVVRLWARCDPLYRGNPCVLYVSMNEEDRSIVRMQPQSEGIYNLTIIFWSNRTWRYTVGVFTGSPEFYRAHGDVQRVRAALAESFVEFAALTFPPGNYTVTIELNSYGTSSSSSFFIRLPTPVNSMLLITAVGVIAYLNVFLVFDTYFRSKKEIVSGRRWMLCSAAVIISILVIYQLYNFTTFAL